MTRNGRALRKSRSERRGVALVLVLGALAVLSVLLTEFQDETSAELASAVSDRDALKAEYLARSAIHLSRLLIAAEPTIRKGMGFLAMLMPGGLPQIPVWDFSDRVLGAFNDAEGSAEFAALTNTDLSKGKNLGIEGGRFDVVIVDEDAKLNVNLAANENALNQNRLAMQLLALMGGDQYNPMFEQRDRDDQFTDRQATCSAIVDWADGNENLFPCDPRASGPSSNAAEDSYYQLLKFPYRRKNAAYDSLDELHLVRGISDDFWATFVDPEPENPRKRVVTVWGQGLVNVNTANAQTLWAIVCAGARTATLCTDPVESQSFIMAVTMLRGFTAGAPLFKSPADFIKVMKGQGLGQVLTSLKIKPVIFDSESEMGKSIATESKMFSIYADGIVPGYQRKTKVRVHAVVDFRNAPPPGLAPGVAGSAVDGGVPPANRNPVTGAPATGVTSPGGSIDALMAALAPNPAGTVIYFRVE